VNKQGFTLVELLVAVFLFLTAVTAFHYLLNSSAITTNSAAELQGAVATLNSQMEKIRSVPFGQLSSYNGQIFANGTGKASVVQVMADLTRIELQLTWDPDKAPLKLATLRSKY
jgi:prepilin-type N-terminal cleavage/methylation domain-containing protein